MSLHQIVHSWRVLVVSDDSGLRGRITGYLTEQRCIAAAICGGDVARRLRDNQFSLVVLDADLESLNACDALRQIRAQSDVPVIMMTTKGRSEIDSIIGLELGADDFIGEPFNLRELVARGRAILRRHEMVRQSLTTPLRGGYRFNGWELRRRTRALTDPSGAVVDITKNEYALLSALLEAAGRVLSRVQLMRATRPHEDIYDRSIDVQVMRLRRKLEADPAAPKLIKTHRGIGYSLEAKVELLF